MKIDEMEIQGDQNLKILLVEDNPGDAAVLQESIEFAHSKGQFPKFTIVRCESIHATLEYLSMELPSLIIIDLTLPDCHGFESFQSVRHLVPNIPIVVMTSDECEQLAMRAVRSGAQDYVVKGNLSAKDLPQRLLFSIERQIIRNQSIKYEL